MHYSDHKRKIRYILSTAILCILSILFCLGCSTDKTDDNQVLTPVNSVNSNDQIWSPDSGVKTDGTLDSSSAISDGTKKETDSSVEVSDETLIKQETENNGSDNNNSSGSDPIILVLDPGHGGIFAGAEYSGYKEKDLNLQLAKYLKECLETDYQNFTVFLTREDDTELSQDLVKELEMRAIFAKEKNADALISLHFNASDEHGFSGCSIFVSRRDNVKAESEKLGKCIIDKLISLGLSNNGVNTRKSTNMFDENGNAYDYYAINRHCANRDLIGIIIEHCFMDSKDDQEYFNSEEKMKALAKADAEGIAEYFEQK